MAELVERAFPDEGFLYVGYPVLAGPDGVNSIDALWISPARGLVIFHIIEGRDASEYEATQDEYANNLETKLRPHKGLMQGRTLLATPSVVTYAPMVRAPVKSDDHPIANDDQLVPVLLSSPLSLGH